MNYFQRALRRNIAEIASHPLGRGQFSDTGSIGSTATAGINVRRIVKWAVFVIATSYFIVDTSFLTIATPLARWMARQRLFIRARKWISSLGPYPSLALFAVPIIILEPVKPVAAYLIATGQIPAGISVLGVGEILNHRTSVQIVRPQAAEDPTICPRLRALATGSRLDGLDASLAGRSKRARFPAASSRCWRSPEA
jgi:hypothetical protein